MRKKILYILQFMISLAIAGFSAVWIINQWIMPIYTRHSEEIVVPDLIGKDFSSASKILQEMELNALVRRQFNRQIPKNMILYQSPEGGSIIKRGRVIRLNVSDDEQSVTVPILKLATIRDAAFILESSGLKPGKQTQQASEEFPSGIVIGQSVEAGTKIQTGSVIDLIISSGKTISQVHVPYLIGKSLTEAKTLTADSFLKLGSITKTYKPDFLPGTITAQIPDSGMTVAPYSEIQIIISTIDPLDE